MFVESGGPGAKNGRVILPHLRRCRGRRGQESSAIPSALQLGQADASVLRGSQTHPTPCPPLVHPPGEIHDVVGCRWTFDSFGALWARK